MNYIVFDLEWNQPLYAGMQKKHPVYLEGEIIEIGAVKFDENDEMLDSFKAFISPKYYRKLNRNVARLTGIAEDDILHGQSFIIAFREFLEWCGEDAVYLTWSNNDLRVMRQNLRVYGMDPAEYITQVFDLQQMFDNQILHEGRSCGLSEALEKVGEEGMEAHDALHDAVNTFLVCKHLDLVKGIAEYRNPIDSFDDGEPIISFSRAYSDALQVNQDKSLLVMTCPDCGKRIECAKWASQGKGKKVSVSACSCGKEFFIRMRTTDMAGGGKRVFWTAFYGNEELKTYYEERAHRQFERFEKRQVRVKERNAAMKADGRKQPVKKDSGNEKA